MLKGRIIHFISATSDSPLSAEANNFKHIQQDSLQIAPVKRGNNIILATPETQQINDSNLKTTSSYTQSHIDSLFQASEKRERQIKEKVLQPPMAVDLLFINIF